MKNLSVRPRLLRGLFLSLLLLAGACQQPLTQSPAADPGGVAAVDGRRLRAAGEEPHNWMSYGRTYDEQRFSTLGQVNQQTVADLGLAWSFDLDTRRGVEATSIVVDGVMYTTSAWSIVHALDARTGRRLWSHDPGVARDKARHACCDVVNRGVAVWNGKVFLGLRPATFDAREAS